MKTYIDSNPSSAMGEITKRYEMENKLLSIIASGNQEQALSAFREFLQFFKSTSPKVAAPAEDALRNSQNMLIVFNTLCRKAVEGSQVHPIYIDRISSRFAKKIENLTSTKECEQLSIEIIKKYCSLVKNYSLATYSLLIRNTLTYVHTNLYNPITLKDIAKDMNVNASYLSAQFKREVGETLTDYIRSHRIHSAINLLNSTSLPIQDIAFQVGIDDLSYFSKQFKQQVGISPMQYRKMLKQ